MALIQFTKNFTDHSTDKGYQFEFFCDRCRNGFTTGFKPSVAGLASGALRMAGSLFGGVLGNTSGTADELQRAIAGPAHDKAINEAMTEAMVNFRKCPKCTHWVCGANCWNTQRNMCLDCAPDFATELASAQAQTMATQMRNKLRTEDLTKGMDLTAETPALCASCNAPTHGAKFCPECGKPTRASSECAKCKAKLEAGTKFCGECGEKVA
jgi:hypothetical protein